MTASRCDRTKTRQDLAVTQAMLRGRSARGTSSVSARVGTRPRLGCALSIELYAESHREAICLVDAWHSKVPQVNSKARPRK
jgi:hypothetical protein